MGQRWTVIGIGLVLSGTLGVNGAPSGDPSSTVDTAMQPATESRTVRLTLSEGTSMSVAASPDGRMLAIDVMGALWTLSANGGQARRILEDGYDARMPAWSPDGRQLAFQAYRSSTWSIWTINHDGSGLQQRTWGAFDDREPAWSPDGTLVAFSSDRSGSYDVWILTIATGEIAQVSSNPTNDFMPSWSPDGREIVFVSDRNPRGVYARTLATGTERLVRSDSGALAGPSLSPDGQRVAYTAIEGPRARLVVGAATISEPNEDVFPFRPQWLPSNDLVYTADGKIKRRPGAGGPARVIDFSAQITFTRPAFTPRVRPLVSRGEQRARGLMHPAISPDGERIVFAALGDLWIVNAAAGEQTPTRLTNDAFVDTEPMWSPDGGRLAFSTDRDGSMDLWIRDMRSGTERKLASRGMSAAWSPNGDRLAYLNPEAELHIATVATGESYRAHERLNEPGRPSWSPDGRAVVMSALRPYSARFREGTNQVLRVTVPPAVPASDQWFVPAPHMSTGMREDSGPVWSPDGTQMAAVVDGHLTVFPVAPDGTPLGPPRRLSTELAGSPSWTADSQRVLYQADEGFRLVDVIDGRVTSIVPRLTWTAPAHTARITVHAGRLFDGRSDALRDDVDVVIEDARITRVQAHADELHQGQVVDASTQTVLPGLIESHTHLSKGFGEALGRIWLAYGITSVRNPAANAFEGQEDREATEAGVRVGPRVFTTGAPFDGTRIYYPGGSALTGGAQVGEQLARAERLGFDFIKTYVRLPDVLQKRVIEEAHRMGLPVTSHEIYPAAAYGADGVEHIRGTSRRGFSPKTSELRRTYRDVIDLLAASSMTITPTIGIQGGFQVMTARDASWVDDPRIQRLLPASASATGRALREKPLSAAELAQREALVRPQERMVATLVRTGGRVIAGTDSPINPYGLTLLMELEHFVRGGVSPAHAIRTATQIPAEAMGYGADLGTIEPGKLADLVIVDGNPLASITDLRRTRRVIKGGVVYEIDALLRRPAAATSSPVAPRER